MDHSQQNNTVKPWQIALAAIIVIGVILYYSFDIDGKIKDKADSKQWEKETSTGVKQQLQDSANLENAVEIIKLNDTLKTQYFDVVASSVKAKTKIIPGWPYDNVLAGKDEMFVVFRATFKNTDNESRMAEAGELLINYNGKNYQFDQPETIMVPGFGLFLDQINPLITKRTTLVYKLPSFIKGKLYWHPGRSADNEAILLGDLNQ